jgi:hypothetical protein
VAVKKREEKRKKERKRVYAAAKQCLCNSERGRLEEEEGEEVQIPREK